MIWRPPAPRWNRLRRWLVRIERICCAVSGSAGRYTSRTARNGREIAAAGLCRLPAPRWIERHCSVRVESMSSVPSVFNRARLVRARQMLENEPPIRILPSGWTAVAFTKPPTMRDQASGRAAVGFQTGDGVARRARPAAGRERGETAAGQDFAVRLHGD